MNADEVKQQFVQAVQFFQAQQYDAALHVLEQLDTAAPNTPDIMYFKARVLGVLNRPQEAAVLCDRLTSLGDPRGEQLKAALGAVPSGPPPMPGPGVPDTAGPPPIMPDQDTSPTSAYAQPPQFGTARKSNKKMNIIGFGLMGALLLAALIVVLVRSRGGDSKDTATPGPASPPNQVASASPDEDGESTAPVTTPMEAEAATSASPDTETPGSSAATESETEATQPSEEASGDQDESPPKEESTEPSEETDGAGVDSAAEEAAGAPSVEELARMTPEAQIKAVTEMDDARLAELLEEQAKMGMAMFEKQATTPAEKQMAAQMRQELEKTDFLEAAKMTKQMFSQMDPQILAQMNTGLLGGNGSSVNLPTVETPSGSTFTDDMMKSFNFEKDTAAEEEKETDESSPESEATSEEPETEEQLAEAATDSTEMPAETDEAADQTKSEPEEETVKPVFGNQLARVIEFPQDKTFGSVYLRRKGAPEREPWEQVADARGKIGIPPDQDVKVQMATYNLDPLLEFKPDDIQVLSLWRVKVRDEDIDPIKHLTGLQELDIRQTRISPDGWEELQEALPKCRILY